MANGSVRGLERELRRIHPDPLRLPSGKQVVRPSHVTRGQRLLVDPKTGNVTLAAPPPGCHARLGPQHWVLGAVAGWTPLSSFYWLACEVSVSPSRKFEACSPCCFRDNATDRCSASGASARTQRHDVTYRPGGILGSPSSTDGRRRRLNLQL